MFPKTTYNSNFHLGNVVLLNLPTLRKISWAFNSDVSNDMLGVVAIATTVFVVSLTEARQKEEKQKSLSSYMNSCTFWAALRYDFNELRHQFTFRVLLPQRDALSIFISLWSLQSPNLTCFNLLETRKLIYTLFKK